MKPATEPGDEDAAPVAGTHVAPNFLNQIDGAGDVGVDDVPHFFKVLIEEAVPRVGEQCLDRPPVGSGVQLVHAFERGEVGLDGLHCRPERAEILRCIFNGLLVGGDQ
jgi:hypothetical protein